jgi:PAS domain S-box-containing protein
MSAPTHILLVEDEAVFAGMLAEILAVECHGPVRVSPVGCLQAALVRLKQEHFDLVLLDLSLPDCQGLDTFAAVRQAAPLLPVILLTGLDDESLSLQALRDGAQDYLVKGRFSGALLARAIRYAIERNQIERKLRQSEAFFRLISESVTDMIAVLDTTGQRLYNSPSYTAVLGNPDRLRTEDPFATIHPEDRDHMRSVFQHVATTGVGQRAEYRFLLPDGAVRHVESQSSVICDDTGKPAKVVVVSRDVSDRIAAEQELRKANAELTQSHAELKATQQRLVQSEKLEAVSTFAAGVAHEVKNPLQTVTLGIDYLRDYVVTDDPNAATMLHEMSQAVRRADATIRALLEFAAYRKGAVTEQDLNDILRRALWNAQTELAGRPIDLVEDLAEDLPPLRLDPRALRHVFINLFATELRKLHAGGTLTVQTRAITLAPAALSATLPPPPPKAAVQLRIESRLRETPPAATTRPPTDFGLLVMKKVIELYGGRVEFTATETGSRFDLTFST